LAASKLFSPGDFVRLVGFLRQEAQIPESIRDYCNDGENIDVIARHRLIICTCTTAGQFYQLGLNTGHFTHVFIDEAGYCTEPEAIIPSVLVALDKAGQVSPIRMPYTEFIMFV
jgi:putative helicase MOV10L1